ncbi:malto-oligosyltrehalose trehalohydrolase [Melissospora conviva]|uniref:malto-oligosyltrehalose trehalohydrolase n=1 Tax=Melissospora conviva TaxID=3388432 RepID=UPI003C2120F2
MTAFAVWAPYARRVRLLLDAEARRRPPGPGAPGRMMHRQAGGWWRLSVPQAVPGTDYAFALDDDAQPLPDPRSAWQPAGVHGPSRVYDHDRFPWTDQGRAGRALPGSVLYELHVGTFTPEGTFDAAAARLGHLAALGVDVVQLLPVNAFNGVRNWGYDGVAWYAPHEPYGGPDGLKRFVDAAHRHGLAVCLDAVYNHFGPSGAYPPRFGPYLGDAESPWGRAINLDGPDSDEVRRYIVDSALGWLRDYHVDGLRLDAVHAFRDTRAIPLLEELSTAVAALAGPAGRPLWLIAESDLNDPRLITARERGGLGLDAQWNDDAHHALHTLLTGERQGYYADFDDPRALAKVWTGGFFHADTWSGFRRRRHGRPVDTDEVTGDRFVAYLQNHDQVGNRAQGDRLATMLSPGLLRVAAVLLLTSPFTPMLFMGEEWGAVTPWQYFTSHPEAELGAAVAAGRRREFTRHGWPPGRVPDPQEEATFHRSQLDWSELDKPAHQELLELHRELIALRRSRPELADPRLAEVEVCHGDGHLVIHRGGCRVVANLAGRPQRVELAATVRAVLLSTGPGVTVMRGAVQLPPETAAVVTV